jgi:predicted ATP-binding protein involved in virulence
MLQINTININNINSISDLKINFRPGVNILCGTNGIGKTTILECISHSFRNYSTQIIRKKVNSEKSSLELNVSINGLPHNYSYIISEEDEELNINQLRIPSRKIIYHSISQRQQARITHLRIDDEGRAKARSDYDLVKGWFFRSYFKKKQLSEVKHNNFNLTKEVFSKLDPSVSFVEAKETNVKSRFNNDDYNAIEIFLKTSYGTINMDYMSSGYKSCFNILFGVIRSIEERLRMSVKQFDGVVLIDEIDLHLHPEWQKKILEIIKWLIPHAQIIITTHSPHIIQHAEYGEIIPMGIEQHNRIYVRDLPESSIYGYQGWTIEEILVDVMGLSDPRSEVFRQKLKKFELALDKENIDEIKNNYEALKSMIHYKNPLATLIKIQAEEYFEEED